MAIRIKIRFKSIYYPGAFIQYIAKIDRTRIAEFDSSKLGLELGSRYVLSKVPS
jgi:hypothetical protein